MQQRSVLYRYPCVDGVAQLRHNDAIQRPGNGVDLLTTRSKRETCCTAEIFGTVQAGMLGTKDCPTHIIVPAPQKYRQVKTSWGNANRIYHTVAGNPNLLARTALQYSPAPPPRHAVDGDDETCRHGSA